MFVCYVSVSIGSVFCVCCVSWSIVPVCLCSLLCLLGVPSVFCVCSTVCLCVAPFSLCVLFMCGVYLLLVCVSVLVSCLLCLCVYCVCVPLYVYYVCLTCVCACALCVCVYCFSVCSLYVPVSLYVCICVYCVLCVLYLLRVCVFLCCVLVLLVTLLVWRLSWWCDGRLFLGLVVLVFWGVWRVWNFFIFYSRFGVGGRLLLGFCYRTFFCGFPWGLCHTRNFFKDITHSYCGYVIPVMSLCMCLLAYLYHTRHCSDIAPVYTCARVCLCLCSYLLAAVSPPCFIPYCPGIVSALYLVLRLLVLVVCRVLHSVLGAGI